MRGRPPFLALPGVQDSTHFPPARPMPHARLAPLALALGLLVAPPAASAAVQQEPDGARDAPQELFRWAQSVEDLGKVAVPAVGSGGWQFGPNGIQYRSVPSVSGDPTYELILRAPYSGNATLPERLLVQVPANFTQRPFAERAVVVGFHSFSISEKDIFINTALPYEAKARGWMLIAPYGLTDTSFGNAQSQASLATVAHALFAVVPFNYRRVYGVGFSMGGQSALSFAMRHLDPQQLQFAGVVVHTPPLDIAKTFANSNLAVQLTLANAKHFGGTPTLEPYAYQRISPVELQPSGLVDPGHAPVLNFAERPVYLHANLADPQTQLLAGVTALSQFLQQRGALVVENLTHDPALGHSWASLPLAQALDFVGNYELPGAPPQEQSFFVDAPGRWIHTEVDAIAPQRVARFRLELAPVALGTPNGFAVDGTTDLERLVLNLPKLGLSATSPLRFQHAAGDATPDELVLRGYSQPPQQVLIGGVPLATWTFDSLEQAVVLQTAPDGSAITVDVLP